MIPEIRSFRSLSRPLTCWAYKLLLPDTLLTVVRQVDRIRESIRLHGFFVASCEDLAFLSEGRASEEERTTSLKKIGQWEKWTVETQPDGKVRLSTLAATANGSSIPRRALTAFKKTSTEGRLLITKLMAGRVKRGAARGLRLLATTPLLPYQFRMPVASRFALLARVVIAVGFLLPCRAPAEQPAVGSHAGEPESPAPKNSLRVDLEVGQSLNFQQLGFGLNMDLKILSLDSYGIKIATFDFDNIKPVGVIGGGGAAAVKMVPTATTWQVERSVESSSATPRTLIFETDNLRVYFVDAMDVRQNHVILDVERR